MRRTVYWLLAACVLAGCGPGQDGASERGGVATPEAAREFVGGVEAELTELAVEANRVQWINATYINDDTQALAAKYTERLQAKALEWAREAARFDDLELDFDSERKLRLIKQGFVLPPPSDPEKNAELAKLVNELPAEYSKFEYCRERDGQQECLDFDAMNLIMGKSRDAGELLEIWTAWREVSLPYKERYARIIELANEGARELGYANAGELWRLGYDMPPEEFTAELERLIGQLQPLYQALHCHVRAKLSEHYGAEVVPPEGPIPAHVLGNMWAQTWANVYPLMGIPPEEQAYDLTEIIEERGTSELEMVRMAENFFVSLGLGPLPETFWERSLFTKPRDRDVICYASAWHIDGDEDVRLKMCIQKTAEDVQTLHHELGHNFYQLAYKDQSFLYKGSANDGFHEALGDTIGLSVTPAYLKELGWIEQEPDAAADVPLLLQSALDKIALLPWTFLVDQWRWRVFGGEFTPENYNQAWWALREQYQGLKPPTGRGEEYFDPGAKFHVPANVPYTRYFLAQVLQFQFHRALCRAAGVEGPLHRCSIYASRAAGEKLADMMAMGQSRPWQDALEALTGSREMDATAIVDYYRPLLAWLDVQNQGRACGW